MLPPRLGRPSHVAPASTRSGATSRSGASTKPRSHMRGCGIVRSGRRSATSSYSSTSTSSVRGPHRSARTRSRVRLAARGRRASSCVRVEVGVDRDDRVQVRVLRRPADRRGLVDARHRDDARRPRSPRARRPRPGGTRAGRRGSSRARGTRARHTFDAHADVVDHRARTGGCELAHLDDDAVHARIGAAHLGDARREPFEQLVAAPSRRRGDRLAHRAVVDGVGEVVARAGRARSTSSSRSTSNGCGRSCSSGSTPCTPISRRPAMRMRSMTRASSARSAG